MQNRKLNRSEYNSLFGHFLARLLLKSKCYSKKPENAERFHHVFNAQMEWRTKAISYEEYNQLTGLFVHFLRFKNSYIACYAPIFTP